MPLVDVSAQNAALDACYGSGHASSWPSSFTCHLYDFDPRDVGEELAADGGYAAVTVANNSTNFPNAVGGRKDSALIDFGTSTAAWSSVASWAGLVSGGVIWEAVQLDEDVSVLEAGVRVKVQLSIFHEDTD